MAQAKTCPFFTVRIPNQPAMDVLLDGDAVKESIRELGIRMLKASVVISKDEFGKCSLTTFSKSVGGLLTSARLHPMSKQTVVRFVS